MIFEYNVNSIILPEGYVVITMQETEFVRIIKDNFTKKNKAIVYIWNNVKYLVDTKSHIVIICQVKERSSQEK